MAEPVVTPTVDPIGNASGNITFTFEEQATASVALYSMSLFCIVLGGLRSLQYVKKHINKKRLIETSVTVSEAKSFPLSASAVLFGLYLFFKPDGRQWLCGFIGTYVGPYVPKISALVNKTLLPSEGTSAEPSFLTKTLEAKLPPPAFEYYTNAIDYVSSIKKETVMYGLLLLLCFEGCVALAALLKPFFQAILRRIPVGDRWPRRNISTLISIKKGKKEMDEGDIEEAPKKDVEYLLKIEFDTHDVIAILFCLAVGISHIYKRHWITNNLLGIAFSIYGIENLHLSSFKAGTWLLAGLFIYDIFWVFATDVMTSVAKGIDAPILLQFPQDIYRNGWRDATKYSMLGLGDIVIPGVFIALLKRFDERIVGKKEAKKGETLKGRYYFAVTCFAYALGLLITMAVMHHFKAAQPALLYLVPCCLFIPLLLALLRGEVSELWNYCEEHLIEKKDKDEKKKVDSAKKNN